MRQKILLCIFNVLLSPLPGNVFSWVKRVYLRIAGVSIGRNVYIDSKTYFCGGGDIVIGNNVFIGRDVLIESNSGVLHIGNECEVNHGSILSANGDATLLIGDFVHIAHFVSVKCSSHQINNGLGGPVAGKSVFRDITIDSGCWLCAGCIILPGVGIGKRSIVAAGAVVTKTFPANVLLAGVPAVVKKEYSVERS